MKRFITEQNLSFFKKIGVRFDIPADIVHHVQTVMRLKPGDRFEILDISGCLLGVEILNSTLLEVFSTSEVFLEEGLRIHCGVGLFKLNRFEWMIEKLAEIGVDYLTPLALNRSVVKCSSEQWSSKRVRFSKIIMEARRQSLSARELVLNPPTSLEDFLDGLKDCDIVFAQPGTYPKAVDLPLAHRDVVVLTGPEGGFSDAEVAFLLSRGCQGVSLGNQILRAETAAIVLSAIFRLRG